MARIRLDRGKKILAAQAVAVPLVTRTAQQIQTGAKRLAPRGSHQSGSGKRSHGQELRGNIGLHMKVSTTQVSALVGSRKPYAATVHEGSKPHIIVSKKGKQLKFRWDRGNAILRARRRGSREFFYFERVRHPGNKRPVRYLTTPLVLFGTANGFKVTRMVGPRITRLP